MFLSYLLLEITTILDDFFPIVKDEFYPKDEDIEKEIVPKVVDFRESAVTLANVETGRLQRCNVGDQFSDWEVMAFITVADKPVVVLEKNLAQQGLIVYISQDGVLAKIKKAVGLLKDIKPDEIEYPSGYFQTITASQPDVLGNKVLQRGEPSYEAVAGFLPPLVAYTFLGTRKGTQNPIVDPNGVIRDYFDPTSYVPELTSANALRGSLGGYLPAINYGYFDKERNEGWEEIAFASEEDEELAVYIRLRYLKSDETPVRGEASFQETMYFSAKPTEATRSLGDFGYRFYSRLLSFKNDWDKLISTTTQIETPEARINDACKAAIIRAFITYVGFDPRYGVLGYNKPRHNTFPSTTLSMVNCCLDWGLIAEAGEFLAHYLQHYVKPDGTFNYYGAAISEYGQMLELVSRYVHITKDYKWLSNNFAYVRSMVDYILRLRRGSIRDIPRDSPFHCLIKGTPEADLHRKEWDDYYYSGSVWCWRGLLEIGRLIAEAGLDVRVRGIGSHLLIVVDSYRQELLASINRSIIMTPTDRFLPPVAGAKRFFETMTEDTLASYTNYRFYPELLYAGILDENRASLIIRYREEKGGSLLGMSRFEGWLGDCPVFGYAYGILSLDMVEKFLLTYYGHLAHHQTRGTFTAYEQVAIEAVERDGKNANERVHRTGDCIPSLLAIPRLTRWMLVFEERDDELIWLNRAAPRRWLADGQKITVRNAPTKWGVISYEINSELAQNILRVNLSLPSEGFDANIRLRLRLPDGKSIKSVKVDGEDWVEFDADGEFVELPGGMKGEVEIVLSLS